jgi:hypothetical protein
MWACGKAEYADPLLLDVCLDRLVGNLAEAAAQHLSMTLYATALLWNDGRQKISEQQVQRLAEKLVQQRQAATPQALSNTLWAVASMGLPLSTLDWQRLLEALVANAETSQDFSNTLWAAAKRKADFAAAWRSATQLTRVEVALLQLADAAVGLRFVEGMAPQAISYSLWALSELSMRPNELVGPLIRAALQRVADMAPQEVSSTALAAARLGIFEAPLFVALVAAAQEQGSTPSAQDICNLCWAVAVADQQQLAQQVVSLSEQLAGSCLWEAGSMEAHRNQLWQVHLWLLDCQPGSVGLAGTLSLQQLQQCADSWEQMLQQAAQQRRTVIEQGVFACAQRLPCLAACCQEVRTKDGAYSVDVTATHTASGRRLAIEADGPTHFLLPDGQLTGETLARNRALAARGFVVVSVPWWEWNRMRRDAARQTAHLRQQVEAALQRLGPGRPPGAGPAAAT